MIQYAVWTWYDNLLNSYDQLFPYGDLIAGFKPVPSPLATIQTLLASGAGFYCNGSSTQTLVRGFVGNIIQFDWGGGAASGGNESAYVHVAGACSRSWF